LVGEDFTSYYTNSCWASSRVSWLIFHMGSPNSSPSATRLWLVLRDLVDAPTRRGTIQLKTLLRGLTFTTYTCAPH
jgi:hypothetical protein